jgi:hypothetical protein
MPGPKQVCVKFVGGSGRCLFLSLCLNVVYHSDMEASQIRFFLAGFAEESSGNHRVPLGLSPRCVSGALEPKKNGLLVLPLVTLCQEN